MNRDKAIEIAANASPAGLSKPSRDWASIVVERADALLAAMGEPKGCQSTSPRMAFWCVLERGHTGPHTTESGWNWNDEGPDPTSCCAATEARVVAEIAAWVRAIHPKSANCFGDRDNLAEMVERGDWRAEEADRG